MADVDPVDLPELRRLAGAVLDSGDPMAEWVALGHLHDALPPAVVLALLDYIDALEAAAPLLHQLATARREYAADPCPEPDRSLLLHEAQTLDNVASVLEGDDTWADLVAIYAPSWRWPEFGAHNPTSVVLQPAAADPGAVAGEPESEETT